MNSGSGGFPVSLSDMTAPDSSKANAPSRTPVLVVDDDGSIRESLEMLLSFEGYEVWTARDGEEAWARVQKAAEAGRLPGAILTDLKMPNSDGIELLERVQTLTDPPPVILISGHGDVATAVQAMQAGAANFLEKPLDESRVRVTLHSALRTQKLERENTTLRAKLGQAHQLVGSSAIITDLREALVQVAQSGASVLITGENGAGKEVLARSIHHHSPSADGEFITVNCAAIPSELIESELFGHEKGSFTGATERRIGHFEAANGGTLFLDEIGDMPLAAQAKVLRALENHEVTRVGGSASYPVDIRVVAATNADMQKAVEEKTFRMDLFYRLNVVPLKAPALREHPADIPELVEYLLGRLAERSGRRAPVVDPEAPGTFGHATLARQRAPTAQRTASRQRFRQRGSPHQRRLRTRPRGRPRPLQPRRKRRLRRPPTLRRPHFRRIQKPLRSPILPHPPGPQRRQRKTHRRRAGHAAQPPLQEARPLRTALRTAVKC